MSSMPRPCVVSMPAQVSKNSDPCVFGPCPVHESEEKGIKEIFIALSGDLVDTVMVPVRLHQGSEGEEASPSLTCRGGVGTAWMRRIPVAGGPGDLGGTGGGVLKTVKELHQWVRRRAGGLAEWYRLYTHVCTPPPRPAADGGMPKPGGSRNCEPLPAARPGVWWSEPMRETSLLPMLAEGQQLVVCTKSYGVTVNSDMWPSWKCMPLNLTGPERLRHGDKLVLHDPVRHDEMTALLKTQTARYPWLKHMQRCGSEMLHEGILVNDEVSFASVMGHTHPPNAFSAGRVALRVVANEWSASRRARATGQTAAVKQSVGVGLVQAQKMVPGAVSSKDSMMWEDESVWASLPAHAHVLPLLFTAGPQLLFYSYMDFTPVTHWLRSCPVQV